jgi:arylsulfatase A-like enzyme
MHLLLALAASLSFQSPPALTTPTAERPNIVFIYMDDHAGRAVGACGSPLTKTPLITRDPRTDQAGTIVDHLVQNIDMAPSILDLAGVEAPTAIHGTSLAPFLTSHHPADWRTSIYYHYQQRDSGRVSHTVAPHYGIRTATHKLIHIYPETAFELYDLRVDPEELHNLYGEPGSKALAETLKSQLSDLRDHFADSTGEPI